MKIITSIKEMQSISLMYTQSSKTIGYVPTMGYLHEGHLTLMKRAREENSFVVASIFVNPLQFGPNEDFESYPRDIKRDEELAKNLGVDYLFYPSVEEMYPDRRTTQLKVVERTDCLCGKKRPGHFDGVATVLLKLFSIIRPTNAYFGLKDAQQVAVVDGLIQDFNLPINLVPVDTVREEDGLAKSSRNVYLTADERNEAPELFRALQLGTSLIHAEEKNPRVIIDKMTDYLKAKVTGKIDYIEIYSYPELQPIENCEGKILIALAVQFSKARLIDNQIIITS